MAKVVVLTEEEYLQHERADDGLCVECLEFTSGGVEPDASGYPCDGCGARQVMGTSEALLRGHIDFKEDL